MAKPITAKTLRDIRSMVEELAPAADDRFRDLEELNASIARLAKEQDKTVSRLGTIGEYLAQDGASEVSCKITEILTRIDAAIDPEGAR